MHVWLVLRRAKGFGKSTEYPDGRVKIVQGVRVVHNEAYRTQSGRGGRCKVHRIHSKHPIVAEDVSTPAGGSRGGLEDPSETPLSRRSRLGNRLRDSLPFFLEKQTKTLQGTPENFLGEKGGMGLLISSDWRTTFRERNHSRPVVGGTNKAVH